MFVTSMIFRMGPLNRLKSGHTPSFKSIKCAFLAQSAHVCFSQPSFQNPSMHHVTHCNRMQHTTTHCNTLQHTATHCNTYEPVMSHIWQNWPTLPDCPPWVMSHTATHCNTLQYTAIHCNTLQHTAPTHVHESCRNTPRIICTASCHTPQRTARHCKTLQDTATHCNTQQNTLQDTARH